MSASEMLHPPELNPGASVAAPALSWWAKANNAMTAAVGLLATFPAIIAGFWKGYKEWKASRLRKHMAELQKIDERISGKLQPLFDDLKCTLEMQVESLSVQSDRRHGENRESLGDLSERVARVEERTDMMYRIIERRNQERP